MRTRDELTLDEALSDPLVQAVMAADDVDPRVLRTMLSGIVATLHHRAQEANPRRWRCYAS